MFWKPTHTFIDLVGQEFGKLLVIKFVGMNSKKQYEWLCSCSCGKFSVVPTVRLNRGSKSCGCLTVEATLKRQTSHGFTIGTPLQKRFFRLWLAMKQRCSNKKGFQYYLYGGRGIVVCDRWLNSFENFRDDMWDEYKSRVEKGEKISLDRYPNVSGNYEPSNCRWATDLEQANNKRNTVKSLDLDSHNKWRHSLARAVTSIMHGEIESISFVEKYLGMSVKEFRSYIQSLWEPWMNWDNYGNKKGNWQIDHIRLCCTFDLSLEEDRLVCFNYKNLRPYDKYKNNQEKIRQPILVTA